MFADAQGATAPAALKVADCRSAAMLIKSALRDLLFCVIGHENNSADWLAALANRVEIIHPSHTTVRTVRYTAVQFLGQIIFS